MTNSRRQTYRDFHAAHRRRDLLMALMATRDYTASEILLRTALSEDGYLGGAAALRADVEWLTESGLVKTRPIGEVLFVTLLQRGRDVAEGLELVDGVARPETSMG